DSPKSFPDVGNHSTKPFPELGNDSPKSSSFDSVLGKSFQRCLPLDHSASLLELCEAVKKRVTVNQEIKKSRNQEIKKHYYILHFARRRGFQVRVEKDIEKMVEELFSFYKPYHFARRTILLVAQSFARRNILEYCLVGSLNKIPLSVAGILLFKVPTSLENSASIFFGLVAGVFFARAKMRERSQS
ncbi:unnamed protein product, partial [Prunus brigantina]